MRVAPSARGIAAACPLTIVALAGCGSTNVDTGQIERQVRSSVADQAGVDPGKVTVECPKDEEMRAGRSFTCTVSYEKRRRTVVIRLEPGERFTATVRTQTTP